MAKAAIVCVCVDCVCGATGRMRNEKEIIQLLLSTWLERCAYSALLFFLPIDHFRYMVLCAFNRCLQWNLLEQCTRAAARRCRQARKRWRCLQQFWACLLFAFYVFKLWHLQTHTHTHILSLSLSLSCCFSLPLSFLFFPLPLSLSAAKTLTHVPLSTVIDIHLCVSRPTPFLPPPPLAPTTGCFSCSARMNLIAQMCVKLYFCIRRQSHISQAEQQQRSSSARHGRHGGQHQLCSQCSLWLCQLLLLWFSQPYS